MNVRFTMTKRLAEMAGFPDRIVEVPAGGTLEDALRALAGRLHERGAVQLTRDGLLHPSILVVVAGKACSPCDRGLPLANEETVDLLLPVAGG